MQDRKSYIFDSLFQIDLTYPYSGQYSAWIWFYLIEDIRSGCRIKSDIIYPDNFEDSKIYSNKQNRSSIFVNRTISQKNSIRRFEFEKNTILTNILDSIRKNMCQVRSIDGI